MARLTAGEIIWRINGDKSGFDKSVKASEKGAKKLGSTWKSVGAKIAGALAAIGLGKMVKGWVKSASQAEEVSNKFGVVFKSVAVEANKASANLAANYGMSTVKSKELLSATGDLLTGLGMSGESALEASISVNKLAADLASFQNIDVKQASDALTKGLLGERESMKSLGIVIQEVDVKRELAKKGQENLTGEALRAARAQVTLEMATKQSKNALGDFARSADSGANVLKRIKAQAADTKVKLGKELLPSITNLGIAFLEASKDGGIFQLMISGTLKYLANFVNGLAIVIKMVNWFTKANGDAATASKQRSDNATAAAKNEANRLIALKKRYKERFGVEIGGLKTVAGLTKRERMVNKGMLKQFDERMKAHAKYSKIVSSVSEKTNADLSSGLSIAAEWNDLWSGKDSDITKNIKEQNKLIKERKKAAEDALSGGGGGETKAFKSPYPLLTGGVKEYADALIDVKDKQIQMAAAMGSITSAASSMANAVSGYIGDIAGSIESLITGSMEAQMAGLDAQMQADLEAAGVADETTEEKYDKQLADLEENLSKAATIEEKAKIKADIKELKAEKVKALEREKIEDKYAEKRKQLEYDIAMVKWKFQLASAISQAPIAVLNAYSSGWAAGPFAGPVLSSLYAGLAAVASGLQIAAVTASKPSFQTGGIVSGNSMAGDNVPIDVNSGEAILTGSQQKRFMDMADGKGSDNMKRVSVTEEVTWSEIYQASKNGDLFIDSRAIQDR